MTKIKCNSDYLIGEEGQECKGCGIILSPYTATRAVADIQLQIQNAAILYQFDVEHETQMRDLLTSIRGAAEFALNEEWKETEGVII